MQTSNEIRQHFMSFFESKGHRIVPSAPMVIKDDPTLMFTNAGMNQFKDIFLGNREATSLRIANTQKCLRVSGKHNDLEEVGHDTYHHTMFEMLGNWSFGDYFKEEAIAWAWELLTGKLGINPELLYATVFEGDNEHGLQADDEARAYWRKYLPESRILNGSKKDNFWEMGDSGPCGPCSEIHIDLRPEAERMQIPGSSLVNHDHPQVIEIWNLVFIQYNRLANGSLVPLPNKHVDTGMGFERLCRVLQQKTSNYDTDIFQPVIQHTAKLCEKSYGREEKTDIAFRVVADHLRAVAFSIADGQLPSNVKAGYVIRRILRRAIRYGYTYLGFREPFINRLVPVLAGQMGSTFPELESQQDFIMKVIAEEELSFLRTLETGIHYLDQIIGKMKESGISGLDGKTAFTLYDTYGFPVDLTALILSENGLSLDHDAFLSEMEAQKNRSRDAAKVETDDWVVVTPDEGTTEFVGYDETELLVKIYRYRKVVTKDKTLYQLVFDKTPFYAESGGQVGDSGAIMDTLSGELIPVISTRIENRLIMHLTEKVPANPASVFRASVNVDARKATARNHSATHLLHYALRKVLGHHVEQKGSLVHPDYFRFDFSHFRKMTQEELSAVESIVNDLIMQCIHRDEMRHMPLSEAKFMGAMSLFGEKYGEDVRVIRFGESIELCGGTHVAATGEIGPFRIVSEGAIAAGIRRIEAITGHRAIEWINRQIESLQSARELLKNPKDLSQAIGQLLEKNAALESELETFAKEKARKNLENLIRNAQLVNQVRFVEGGDQISPAELKDLAFSIRASEKNLVMVFPMVSDGKASLSVFVSPDITAEKGISASALIKEISPLIQGGGGGQDFFASAGGKNPAGLPEAVRIIREKF
ncbi:MAG TPA: alanine--tRNA ligase [Bacteroidales bacterium]|nr:alanine--tRNA ligase [Bacteroidales bacterium]HRZ48932.1 alanine--tRNA ligase [Bacteroidales bacterium]